MCDRYSTTTLVYQGLARGLGEATVMRLACMVEDTVRPDLSLVLDLDPEIALARVSERGDANRLDREDIDPHRTVHRSIQHYAERFPDTHRLVGTDTDPQTLTQRLLVVIEEHGQAFMHPRAGGA